MGLSRYESAIQRWVDALNGRGAPERVKAAVHPDALVVRFGFNGDVGVPVEDIKGVQRVAAWLARTPEGYSFETVGEVGFAALPEGASEGVSGQPVARVRYQVSGEDFSNGGTWRFRLSSDDLITWLEHEPDPL